MASIFQSVHVAGARNARTPWGNAKAMRRRVAFVAGAMFLLASMGASTPAGAHRVEQSSDDLPTSFADLQALKSTSAKKGLHEGLMEPAAVAGTSGGGRPDVMQLKKEHGDLAFANP